MRLFVVSDFSSSWCFFSFLCADLNKVVLPIFSCFWVSESTDSCPLHRWGVWWWFRGRHSGLLWWSYYTTQIWNFQRERERERLKKKWHLTMVFWHECSKCWKPFRISLLQVLTGLPQRHTVVTFQCWEDCHSASPEFLKGLRELKGLSASLEHTQVCGSL